MPNCYFEVETKFTAPLNPGKYRLGFKCCYENKTFGEQVWFDFVVDDQAGLFKKELSEVILPQITMPPNYRPQY